VRHKENTLFDVEHIFLTDQDDPKIREVTTRMSRFVCNLETGREYLTEKAYIAETNIPIVFSRYTPDKVTSEKNVYLITKLEKSGSRIFLAPGVMVLILFMRKRVDEKSAKEAQVFFLDYFAKQINGACINGNDMMIGGKKVMGMTVMFNEQNGMMMVRFMLTLTAKAVENMTSEADFAEKKYKNITGVCDETGMSEDAIRTLVNGFIEVALSWRPGNAAE
jgi:hypothetical protein